MSSARRIVHDWIWIVLLVFCIGGIFNPKIGLAAIVCMLAPSFVAFFRGRFWCGSFCPRGSFNDKILPYVNLKKPIPKFMKAVWFRNLFFIVLMSFFAIQLIFAWGNITAVGAVFVRMIIITTILTIVLGTIYNPRTWCVFCPMGTMAYYVSKLRFSKDRTKHITFNKDTCTNCGLCSKHCPMGIHVLAYKEQDTVLSADCIKCCSCIQKCPKNALYLSKKV